MTRLEFIKELDELLVGLPDKERLDILADYTEHFLIGKENGKSEHEIAAQLGSPKTLAKEVLAGYHIHQAQADASLSNITRAILATLSLGFFNLIFVLGPFIGLLGVLVGLYCAAVALMISPLPLIVSSGLPNTLDEVIFVFCASLTTVGLGLMLVVGLMKLTSWLYRVFLRYLKFNLRLIRGK